MHITKWKPFQQHVTIFIRHHSIDNVALHRCPAIVRYIGLAGLWMQRTRFLTHSNCDCRLSDCLQCSEDRRFFLYRKNWLLVFWDYDNPDYRPTSNCKHKLYAPWYEKYENKNRKIMKSEAYDNEVSISGEIYGWRAHSQTLWGKIIEKSNESAWHDKMNERKWNMRWKHNVLVW